MTISVEQIKKLIGDYRRSESVCIQSGRGPVASGQASVWRMVIEDLESLLPRKSMADVDPETWPEFVGTWVEHDERKYIITGSQNSLGVDVLNLFYPAESRMRVADPDKVFPLDGIDRVWDSEGNPV